MQMYKKEATDKKKPHPMTDAAYIFQSVTF